jgi:WhiB family transcriptional regulator, redox-sensing transcriptional regulator
MAIRANWRKDAACRDVDPELFFPISKTALGQIEKAKRICHICPAQHQCLTWALEVGVTDGVWGGATPEERRVIRRAQVTKVTRSEDDDDTSYSPAPEHRGNEIRARAFPRRYARSRG